MNYPPQTCTIPTLGERPLRLIPLVGKETEDSLCSASVQSNAGGTIR